jgi:hypothetical protein
MAKGLKRRSSDITWFAGDDHGLHEVDGYSAVYALSAPKQWPVKLGVTPDPRRRVMELQHGNPETLKIQRILWAPSLLAFQLEGECIRLLTKANKLIGHGWYDVPVVAMDDVFKVAIRATNVSTFDQHEMAAVVEGWGEARIQEARLRAQIAAARG